MFGIRPALVLRWCLLTPDTARFLLSLRGQHLEHLDGSRAENPGDGTHTNGDSNSDCVSWGYYYVVYAAARSPGIYIMTKQVCGTRTTA